MTPARRERRAIPVAAWVIAAALFIAVLLVLAVLVTRGSGDFPFPLLMLIPAVFLAGYVLLVGYVYEDAKRRGMRYVMWTWLAILVPNGIGIILYFLLREPIPVFCSACGAPAQSGFAYCSRCGVGMAPACPKCNKVCQEGWSHCPYCGTSLQPARTFTL